jgi:F-type H+-transporting ATPase subunit gamma
MPSLIDLRRRIRTVRNIQQITKAMKMVSASKLRRAQERMMSARPYASEMQRVLGGLAARVDPSVHPLLAVRDPGASGRTLVVVVSADKGLCGSFNTNIIKAAGAFIVNSPQPCTLGLVGRKGRDFFAKRGFDVFFEAVGLFQKLRFEDARSIAQTVIDAFVGGQADRVVLVFNEFKSVISQRVVVDQLLPVQRADIEAARGRKSTTSTSRRRRTSSTSSCRGTSKCRSTARSSSRTRRSSPRR